MTVLVVGESLVDVVTQADGEETRRAGGSPFNVAIGLARLGVSTQLATLIGADDDGQMLRSALTGSSVDLVELIPQPERTATAVAMIAADGSATYAFDIAWNPSGLPDPTEFAAVHVGSIGAWLAPGALEVAALTAKAAAAGIPVTFDPNIRLSIQDDLAELRNHFDAIAPHATVIKMSDEDAAGLFPGRPLDDLASELAAMGPLVAITRGGGGALICAGREIAYTSAPEIEVVDTIGAGDSFMAALVGGLAALSWGRELDAHQLTGLGELATTAAAITCMRPGADPPRRSEVEDLFATLEG
ncbi:MAG: carbohydrate kinase [Actinomycetota bacterium]|nr:carbohydrate kinase [Actinomycetota bacterium]